LYLTHVTFQNYVDSDKPVKILKIDGDEYTIYSDKYQILVAEIGQAPGIRPPFMAISDWVNEKLGIKKNDPAHYPIVVAVQNKIEAKGLEPFAPMEKAVIDTVADLEKRLGEAMDQA